MKNDDFGPYTSIIESAIITTGKGAIDLAFLPDLSEEQFAKLYEITNDPNHPWMIKYREGVEEFDKQLGEEASHQESDVWIEAFKSWITIVGFISVFVYLFVEHNPFILGFDNLRVMLIVFGTLVGGSFFYCLSLAYLFLKKILIRI